MKRTVRCEITFGQAPFGAAKLVQAGTQDTIETVRGNATVFQFGFFDTAGEILSLADVESLNLKLQPSRLPGGDVLADQTLAAAELDLTTDAESWEAGTKQHAEFEFTNAEMNLDPGVAVKEFWLVLTAVMSDGSEVTLGGGGLLIHEDNNAAADPPPENAGTAITLEQADARYAALDDAFDAAQLASVTHAATSKETPADADELPLWDSVAAGLKKLTWANLKATAKAYFDGVYAALTHAHAMADITGLVLALAGKAAASHSHVSADLTDASTGTNGTDDALKLVKYNAAGDLQATGSLSVYDTLGYLSGLVEAAGGAESFGRLHLLKSNGTEKVILKAENITGIRVVQAPNAAGTLALTSNTDGTLTGAQIRAAQKVQHFVATADQVKTNDAVTADDAELNNFAFEANATYRVDFALVITNHATPKVNLQFTHPTNSTNSTIAGNGMCSRAGSLFAPNDGATVVDLGQAQNWGGRRMVNGYFITQIGAAAGTGAFQWAQGTADANAVTRHAGSTVTVTRLYPTAA